MCPVPAGLHDSGENLERRKRLGGGDCSGASLVGGSRSASPQGAFGGGSSVIYRDAGVGRRRIMEVHGVWS